MNPEEVIGDVKIEIDRFQYRDAVPDYIWEFLDDCAYAHTYANSTVVLFRITGKDYVSRWLPLVHRWKKEKEAARQRTLVNR